MFGTTSFLWWSDGDTHSGKPGAIWTYDSKGEVLLDRVSDRGGNRCGGEVGNEVDCCLDVLCGQQK